MDKRQDFTGINPDIRIDQLLIDSNEHRPAIHALMKSYAQGTNPNYIISGCDVTVGGAIPTNTWSITSGYIYLNDEVIKVESQSGTFNSSTQYLSFSKSTTYNSLGDVVYLDGTPRQTWQVNRGIITVQASVLDTELDAINGETLKNKINRLTTGGYESLSGTATIQDTTQFVKFTLSAPASLTLTVPDADNKTVYHPFIWINIDYTQGILAIQDASASSILSGIQSSGQILLVNNAGSWEVLVNTTSTDYKIKTKVISIGTWNMDTTSNVSIAHGLTLSKIVGIRALINNDSLTVKSILSGSNVTGDLGGIISVDSTNVNLYRTTSGYYDSALYSGAVNRGVVLIDYYE